MIKKIFENKFLSFLISFVEWIVCFILVMLITVSLFQKFSNSESFYGYRIYTVASNSMIPTYTIGDTLLIKDMEAKYIEIGDAVTYLGEAPAVKGLIITHQVVGKDLIDGKYQFHTKGIANNIEDPIVYEDQVLGKVIYRFYTLSIFGKITSNLTMMFVFITIPLAILVGIELVKVFNDKDEDEDDEDNGSDKPDDEDNGSDKPDDDKEEEKNQSDSLEEENKEKIKEEIKESQEDIKDEEANEDSLEEKEEK